jgi:hypothetical protein
MFFHSNAGQILVKTLTVNTCITLETETHSKELPIYMPSDHAK